MAKVKQLYAHLQPKHYTLNIRPDYRQWRFRGSVSIVATVQEDSTTLTLHAVGLEIHEAHINTQSAEIEYDEENRQVHLHAQQAVTAGDVDISISYEGPIQDNMHGLYVSSFVHQGEDKYLLVTQFESNHAREMLPCIDEPKAKAVFELSIDIPARLTAVSNTPIARQTEEESGLVHIVFEPSPVMSTYLLALVVGELEYTEDTTSYGTTVRVYATPDNVQHADFALQSAVSSLDFYNDYFNIPYPLAKCDLIALPDFASAAMENWGCITFREAMLLVDPENTSLHTKQITADVIAHELVHQWFGNLVTMQWWNDLWLNEGFATWVANLAVDHIYPEWNIWEQFAGENQIPALRLDSLRSSHPIEVPIHDPEEIDEIFDAISYCKGASALHMLHSYLGPEDFRRGLSHYLQQHAYQNTRTNDLWDALAEISGKPVENFMSSWTQQTGYPLLQYEQTDQGMKLTQHRFRLLPDNEQTENQTWYVPVTAVNHEPTFLLNTQTDQWSDAPPLPAKLNGGQDGFYRVHYREEDLEHLFGNFLHFSPVDRLGLIDDTFELAKAGYADTGSVLSLINTVKHEKSDVVWDVVFLHLSQIQRVFGEDILAQIYGGDLTSIQLQRLGWDAHPQESSSDSLLRPVILTLAARCQVESVIKEAFHRFQNEETIDPDIRRAVYTMVSRNGDVNEFEILRSMHNETDFAEEKLRLAHALCSFTQESLIEKSLAMITSDYVRKQEVRHWMAYIFSNPYAKEKAWQWLRDNWQWLDDNFRGSPTFPDFPKIAARSFGEEAKVKEFENFFRGNVPDRSLDQAIENIRIQATWYERDYKAVDTQAAKN